MPFTLLYAIVALILFVIVVGAAYKIKGGRVALLAAVVTLTFEIALFFAMIAAITSMMAN